MSDEDKTSLEARIKVLEKLVNKLSYRLDLQGKVIDEITDAVEYLSGKVYEARLTSGDFK